MRLFICVHLCMNLHVFCSKNRAMYNHLKRYKNVIELKTVGFQKLRK